VRVRRVRPDEWQELRAIRLRALEDSPDSFGSTAVEARQRDDERWRTWATAGASSSESAVFVAVDGDRMVGLGGSFLHEDDPKVAQIVAMWVDPDCRGRRLGEQLLEAATRWATEEGAEKLVLDVTETNLPARRLYERLGFTETGRSDPLRSNPSLLTLQMAKPLAAGRAAAVADGR
jgi:ribosomal protein S18 acetylase RimI-like enzyme